MAANTAPGAAPQGRRTSASAHRLNDPVERSTPSSSAAPGSELLHAPSWERWWAALLTRAVTHLTDRWSVASSLYSPSSLRSCIRSVGKKYQLVTRGEGRKQLSVTAPPLVCTERLSLQHCAETAHEETEHINIQPPFEQCLQVLKGSKCVLGRTVLTRPVCQLRCQNVSAMTRRRTPRLQKHCVWGSYALQQKTKGNK